jgi:hypothetical protein
VCYHSRREQTVTTQFDDQGERLSRDDGIEIAQACVHAAGLSGRVEVACDERRNAITISGPDQFGLMGMTAYMTLRIGLPASRRAIGLAVARHVFGEFYATDEEIAARAAELPLALAMLLVTPG